MPSINSRSNIDHVLNNSESECIRRLRSRKSSLSRRAPIGCVPLPNWGVGRRSARPIGTAGNAHQLPEDCKMASWKDLHFWKKKRMKWNDEQWTTIISFQGLSFWSALEGGWWCSWLSRARNLHTSSTSSSFSASSPDWAVSWSIVVHLLVSIFHTNTHTKELLFKRSWNAYL